MAISLNGVSGFGNGSYRTSTPRVANDVRTAGVSQGAQVGAPPSQQQLGLNRDERAQPLGTLELQGTFHVSSNTAIEAPRRMSQLSEAQLPIHQLSYARSAYEAASAAQTVSDAQKILG